MSETSSLVIVDIFAILNTTLILIILLFFFWDGFYSQYYLNRVTKKLYQDLLCVSFSDSSVCLNSDVVLSMRNILKISRLYYNNFMSIEHIMHKLIIIFASFKHFFLGLRCWYTFCGCVVSKRELIHKFSANTNYLIRIHWRKIDWISVFFLIFINKLCNIFGFLSL